VATACAAARRGRCRGQGGAVALTESAAFRFFHVLPMLIVFTAKALSVLQTFSAT
jgi:hypothetical protein